MPVDTIIDINGMRIGIWRISPKSEGTKRSLEHHAEYQVLEQLLGDTDKILHTSEGAPVLGKHKNLGISISHSQSLVAVAINDLGKEASGNDGFGIDIEYIAPRLTRVSRRFLSDKEQEAIDLSDLTELCRAWTAKEAIYKAHGKEAVDFAKAIRLSDDLSTGTVGNRTYAIEYRSLDQGKAILAIATTK